jgi:hypothetical protein
MASPTALWWFVGLIALGLATCAAAPAASRAPTSKAVDDFKLLFANVCQIGMVPNASPGMPAIGCTCCPPFDECRPAGSAQDVESVYAPNAIAAGAFTRAGADQRAVAMQGCESHAENYGGMLLLERGAQGFQVVRYVSALAANACWTVRRKDGRDLLVCERDDAHQGTAEQSLFQWDLSGSDEQLLNTNELVYVSDNELSGCWSELGAEVISTRMLPPRFDFRPGRPLLTLDFDIRQGRVSKPYLARCQELMQAAEAAPPDPRRIPRNLLPARMQRQVFGFDGSQLVQKQPSPSKKP